MALLSMLAGCGLAVIAVILGRWGGKISLSRLNPSVTTCRLSSLYVILIVNMLVAVPLSLTFGGRYSGYFFCALIIVECFLHCAWEAASPPCGEHYGILHGVNESEL